MQYWSGRKARRRRHDWHYRAKGDQEFAHVCARMGCILERRITSRMGPGPVAPIAPKPLPAVIRAGRIQWCVEVGKHKGKELPYIDRCDVEWPELKEIRDRMNDKAPH